MVYRSPRRDVGSPCPLVVNLTGKDIQMYDYTGTVQIAFFPASKKRVSVEFMEHRTQGRISEREFIDFINKLASSQPIRMKKGIKLSRTSEIKPISFSATIDSIIKYTKDLDVIPYVDQLPKHRDDVIIIVSPNVAAFTWLLDNIYFPSFMMRDSDGAIIGWRELGTFNPPE